MSAKELARELGLLEPTDEQADVAEYPPYVEVDGEQYAAPLLVVAGAGSGKTQTLSLRASYMTSQFGVRPESILGLTFTRKAAGELAGRLAAHSRLLTGIDGSVGEGFAVVEVPVGTTYNSFALGIVQEFGPLIGIDPKVTHLDAAASWQLMSEIVAGWPYDISGDLAESTIVERALGLREDIANQAMTMSEVEAGLRRLSAKFETLREEKGGKLAGFFLEGEQTVAQRRELLAVIEAFEDAKAQTGRMDYADQVLAAIRIVEEVDHVRDVLRARHKVVFLDEFQDTSVAQMRFLSALFSDHPVTAVGDPNQAIYGWRGASAASLQDFHRLFNPKRVAPQETLKLSMAWRNDRSILNAANVIAAPLAKTPSYVRRVGSEDKNARPGIGEQLGSQRQAQLVQGGSAPKEVVNDAADAEFLAARDKAGPGTTEANFRLRHQESIDDIVDFVEQARRDLYDPEEGKPGSVGVLCRRNAPLRPILQALHERGIPAQMVGSESLLGHPAVLDLRAALQVAVDPGDSPSLMRLLTNLDLGASDLRALGDHASSIMWREQKRDPESGRSPILLAEAVDSCEKPGDVPGMSAVAAVRVARLRRILRELRQSAALSIPAQVQTARRLLALDIESEADPTSEDVSAVLDTFADVATEYDKSAPRPTMEAFLAWLTAAELKEKGLSSPTADIDADAVQVMTIHGSKGLEWDAVAIAEFSAGRLPSQGSGNRKRGGEFAPPPNPGPASGWWKDASVLPYSLRQDAAHLPDPAIWGSDKTATYAQNTFREEVGQYLQDEERRLAYVAITRARHRLLMTGSWFDTGTTPRFPSLFVTQLLASAPASDGVPPVTKARMEPLPPAEEWADLIASESTAMFPREPGPVRRRSEQAGVKVLQELPNADTLDVDAGLESVKNENLRNDARLLLAQLEDQRKRAKELESADPEKVLAAAGASRALSVTEVAAFKADPVGVAADLLRPVPQRPMGSAQLGSHLHRWMEGHLRVLASSSADKDLQPEDEIPASLVGEDKEIFAAIQRAVIELDLGRDYTVFGIEIPFSWTEEQQLIRGRIDAVLRDKDGNYVLVDWKTSRYPKRSMTEQEKLRYATQLSYYRKAWQEQAEADGVELSSQLVFVFPGGTWVVPEGEIF